MIWNLTFYPYDPFYYILFLLLWQVSPDLSSLTVMLVMREIHILVFFLLSLPIFHIAFIIEEATGCINEEAVGAKAQANPPSCIFISCFSVSIAISIIRPDFSSDLTILIISSLSSFEMNKENLFPALTTPHPVFF